MVMQTPLEQQLVPQVKKPAREVRMGPQGVQVGADFVPVRSTRKDGLILGERGWYRPAPEFQSGKMFSDWDIDATIEHDR